MRSKIMTYLLNTCLISELVAKQPNQQVVDWLEHQTPEILCLSVITMSEIAKGMYKLGGSQRKVSENLAGPNPSNPLFRKNFRD
jgi:toxin FitB